MGYNNGPTLGARSGIANFMFVNVLYVLHTNHNYKLFSDTSYPTPFRL